MITRPGPVRRENTIPDTLVRNLKRVIPLLGDPHEVAEMFNVELTTVARWSEGKEAPAHEVLAKIAKRLSLNLSALRYGVVGNDSCD